MSAGSGSGSPTANGPPGGSGPPAGYGPPAGSNFPVGSLGFKTSPQHATFAHIDEIWAAAAELRVFSAGWMNDHLTDMSDAGGPSLEALTLLGALVHRVPGVWVGHGVLSNTFRHPAVLAKAATVLDQATAGRFVLGLGAGWHEGEHRSFGIPLPPIRERIDRLESAVEVLHALFSPAAAGLPGVTRPDRYYPLDGATNEPPPATPGGPPIFLGGQRRRGIALAGRSAAGWLLPGDRAGDADYFTTKREELLRALDAAGRAADGFAFVAQVSCGATPEDRRRAVEAARALQRSGATHVILGMSPGHGPDGLRTIARDVAEPLLEADGWHPRRADDADGTTMSGIPR
jgi:alkanesulfonate monooxygenase SsuD/methylene tetrahydromethanopterin reductase-like flavin-dependent oxidoreductase (luciferase family)